jgi:protein gp37
MSGLFHEAVPAEFIVAVWRAMQATPQHTYQILTTRPDRMADITASLPVLSNAWLGTSVENADYLGALTICARSMLPSGLSRSNHCSGLWRTPI